MSQRDFDYDRGFTAGEAERETLQLKIDALQQLLNAADERMDRLEAGIKWETERNALLLASLTDAEDMLSVTSLEAGQRLDELEQRHRAEVVAGQAAERRVEVLEGLLLQTNELLYAIQGDPGAVPSSSIDAMRGEVFTALKPAEGGGDEN